MPYVGHKEQKWLFLVFFYQTCPLSLILFARFFLFSFLRARSGAQTRSHAQKIGHVEVNLSSSVWATASSTRQFITQYERLRHQHDVISFECIQDNIQHPAELTFICSKSTIKTLDGVNKFKVNNKGTRTTSMTK